VAVNHQLTTTVGQGVGFERTRRITGFLVGTLDRFNNAKRAEERDRVKHGVCGAPIITPMNMQFLRELVLNGPDDTQCICGCDIYGTLPEREGLC